MALRYWFFEVLGSESVKHGSRSFRSAAAKIWNSLPQHLRDISSFGVFKNQINAWNGGLVHVHAVLLVETFLAVSLFSCKIFMLNFLIFQRTHILKQSSNAYSKQFTTKAQLCSAISIFCC